VTHRALARIQGRSGWLLLYGWSGRPEVSPAQTVELSPHEAWWELSALLQNPATMAQLRLVAQSFAPHHAHSHAHQADQFRGSLERLVRDRTVRVFRERTPATAPQAHHREEHAEESRSAHVGPQSSPPPPAAPTITLTRTPDQFAPSVEVCTITYTVTDPSTAATAVRLVIRDRAGATVATLTGQPFSAGSHSVDWDGRAGGRWVLPTESPFRVTAELTWSGGTVTSAPRNTAVIVHDVTVTHTPENAAQPTRIYKAARTDTRTEHVVVARVRLRRINGSGVVTGVPVRIDWSFTAPATNCPKAKGGLDNTDAHFGAAPGHALSGGLNIDAHGTANASGEHHVKLRASVVAGDRFTVHARVLRDPANAAAGDLGHADSPTFEVWKRLQYNGLYRMVGAQSGVDVGSLASVANIQPAYTPAFTEYTAGAVHNIAWQEYIGNLVAPTAAQLPNKMAVRAQSNGADTRTLTVRGILVAADGTTSLGTDVITLAGAAWVNGTREFQKVVAVTASGPDAARTVTITGAGGSNPAIATLAPGDVFTGAVNVLFDTEASVQTKAQAWVNANYSSWSTGLRTLRTSIGATGHHMVGCGWLHPKYDSRTSTGATSYYRAYPGVRVDPSGGSTTAGSVHPDESNWTGFDGMNTGTMSCMFLNVLDGHTLGDAYTRGVARHEIGHASDHITFGPTDHCPQPASVCLMNANSTAGDFCTAASDHSQRRARGWGP
jgi:hypothetical protein